MQLQELLYAENKHSLLIVLQAMDTGGKDGAIPYVMDGVNPQGCTVVPFKVPSAKNLTGPRLPVAHPQSRAAETHDRYLQPIPLRGCAGGACALSGA